MIRIKDFTAKMMSPGRVVLTLILFLVLVTTASAQKEELRYGETEIVNIFDPYKRKVARGNSDRIYGMIYETLVHYDFEQPEDQRITPLLATSWEREGTNVMIFRIRPDVVWHGGTTLSAEDVVFTVDYVRTSASSAQARDTFKGIQAEALDPHTVRIDFGKPRSERDMLALFSTVWIIPRHRFNANYLPLAGRPSLGIQAEGTGPFKMNTQSVEGDVFLELHPAYWNNENRGDITHVTQEVTPDMDLLVDKARTGFTQVVVEVLPRHVSSLTSTGRFEVELYSSNSYHGFGYNFTNPDLAKREVRQALTFAVNRPELLNQWYLGNGRVLAGPDVPSSPYFDPEIQPREFNQIRAKELLQQAGYEDRNGDGWVEDASGQRLQFNLLAQRSSDAGDTQVQNIVNSYVFYMKQIGVDVLPEYRTYDDWEEMVFNKDPSERGFDIILIRWTFDQSYDITPQFYSGNNVRGGYNITNYKNVTVDQLIERFREETDPERRRQYIRTIQIQLNRDAPYTFLYSINNAYAYRIKYTNRKIDYYKFFNYLWQWKVLPGFEEGN